MKHDSNGGVSVYIKKKKSILSFSNNVYWRLLYSGHYNCGLHGKVIKIWYWKSNEIPKGFIFRLQGADNIPVKRSISSYRDYFRNENSLENE